MVMLEVAPINAVMRSLADPTRRPVFERIVMSDEITVVDIAGWFADQPSSLRPDGVHVTEDTGRVVLDEYLAGQLLAAAGR